MKQGGYIREVDVKTLINEQDHMDLTINRGLFLEGCSLVDMPPDQDMIGLDPENKEI